MTAPGSILETLEAALDFIGIYTEPKHPRAVVSLKLQATIARVQIIAQRIEAASAAKEITQKGQVSAGLDGVSASEEITLRECAIGLRQAADKVTQCTEMVTAIAQRIEARSDETAQPVRPEGREPDGEADAPNPNPPDRTSP